MMDLIRVKYINKSDYKDNFRKDFDYFIEFV